MKYREEPVSEPLWPAARASPPRRGAAGLTDVLVRLQGIAAGVRICRHAVMLGGLALVGEPPEEAVAALRQPLAGALVGEHVRSALEQTRRADPGPRS